MTLALARLESPTSGRHDFLALAQPSESITHYLTRRLPRYIMALEREAASAQLRGDSAGLAAIVRVLVLARRELAEATTPRTRK